MDYKILFQIKKFTKNQFQSAFFTDISRIHNLEKSISFLPKNSIVILREYNLSQSKRQELALKIQKLCKKFNHFLFIGKNIEIARKIKANGVHFSDLDKNSWRFISKKYPKLKISFACHSLKSIKKAQNSNSDILFLSPIFATKSHENSKILKTRNLAKACEISKKPIFALGGINQKNLNSVIKSKARGFGAIEIFNKT